MMLAVLYAGTNSIMLQQVTTEWTVMQGLLSYHMGMSLANMQAFAKLPPEQRLREGLAGARLPARGFYRVKTVSRDQLQDANAARDMTSFKAPSLWSRLSRIVSRPGLKPVDSTGQSDLRHVSEGLGNVAGDGADKDVQITITNST